MPRSPRPRATTLSISLTPTLAAEVSARVESGRYASASELLREALRLLIRTEELAASVRSPEDSSSLAATRLRTAAELQALGLTHQAERVRQEHPELTDEERLERLEEFTSRLEVGPGLRSSPERLAKLKRHGSR